jgi:hypothetical protein
MASNSGSGQVPASQVVRRPKNPPGPPPISSLFVHGEEGRGGRGGSSRRSMPPLRQTQDGAKDIYSGESRGPFDELRTRALFAKKRGLLLGKLGPVVGHMLARPDGERSSCEVSTGCPSGLDRGS